MQVTLVEFLYKPGSLAKESSLKKILLLPPDAERRQLMLEAELAGVKSGCEELEKQMQLVKQVHFQKAVVLK